MCSESGDNSRELAWVWTGENSLSWCMGDPGPAALSKVISASGILGGVESRFPSLENSSDVCIGSKFRASFALMGGER